MIVADPLLSTAQFGHDVDALVASACELGRTLASRQSFPEKDDHGRPMRYTEQERLVVLLGQIVWLAKEAKKRADKMAKEIV